MIVGESGSGKSSLLRAIAGLWYNRQRHASTPAPGGHPVPAAAALHAARQPAQPAALPAPGPAGADAELLRCSSGQPARRRRALRRPGRRARLGEGALGRRAAAPRLRPVLLVPAALRHARRGHQRPRQPPTRKASTASCRPQTTLVSVAHRAGILKYHSQVLELNGEGGWQASPAEAFRFAPNDGD
jgi:putative ATP-binding cassette transporter